MNKKIIVILLLVLVLIVVCLLLPNSTKETYAVGVTLVDTVKNKNPSKVSSYSAGASGVFYTNDHEYRYIGAEVDNYVSFNNDLYRIIGVFDENTHGVSGEELVKVIRSRKLGSFSWGVFNSSAISGEYDYYNNNWAGTAIGVPANINVLLNQFFYNKTSSIEGYSDCTTWTYFSNSQNYRVNDCSDIVGYGIDESLREYIKEVDWHLKGYDGASYDAQEFYICERSGDTEITNCTGRESVKGNIGLMYVSDYIYASSYSASTNLSNGSSSYIGINNWLYKGSEWTITHDRKYTSYVFYVTNRSSVSRSYTHSSLGVRPTFYLKSSVYVTGGSGTFDDPYTIACDDCN